jgi:phage/plasmid primase-like uncharacterized protein
MSTVATLSRLRWDQLKAKPINLPLARKVSAHATCPVPACGGRLVIDHDDDPHGEGRLSCMLCGHDAAFVKLRHIVTALPR